MTKPSKDVPVVPTDLPMKGSLTGRLKRLSLSPSNALSTVFEAINNSFQAIAAGTKGSGKIEIHFHREGRQAVIEDVEQPVTAIDVIDNGIGFTDENFESFRTPDSLHKFDLGGKGIGRLLWLKAFSEVRVNSIYATRTGTKRRRSFSFKAHDERPIQQLLDEVELFSPEVGTSIQLVGCISPYSKEFPSRLEAVADKIIIRFLLKFLSSECPVITVRDGEVAVNLNERFAQQKVKLREQCQTQVKGQTFDIHIIQMREATRRKHRLYLCAAGVEVESAELDRFVEHLPSAIPDHEEKNTVLAVYITSPLLDSAVNEQRTAFNLARDYNLIEPTIQEILEAAGGAIRQRYQPLIDAERQQVVDAVQRFIRRKKPIYRAALPFVEENAGRFAQCQSDEQKDILLNTIVREKELHAEASFEQYKDPARAIAEGAMRSILADLNDAASVRLGQYVAKRRAVLYTLRVLLQKRSDGTYNREASIHDLVFPMGLTSEEVPVDRWNLWLIDERLSFHDYLASDKRIQKHSPLASQSSEEPDLLILDRPGAFSDSAGASHDVVSLIELKRPQKEAVGSGELPHEQALRYIKSIEAGKEADRRGRPINAPKARFYCYLVCDITPQLREKLIDDHSFTPSPDNAGYFKVAHRTDTGRFVSYEYISYDKLYEDARKRNDMLFHKLGIALDPTSNVGE